MRTVTPGIEAESRGEVARIAFGVGGAMTFVVGCAAIGIGGADRQAVSPLIGIGLAFYATSLTITTRVTASGRTSRRPSP